MSLAAESEVGRARSHIGPQGLWQEHLACLKPKPLASTRTFWSVNKLLKPPGHFLTFLC